MSIDIRTPQSEVTDSPAPLAPRRALREPAQPPVPNDHPSRTAPPPRGVLPVVLLALATVITAVSSLMLALPSLAEHTGASSTQLTWIVDAYSLAFAALLLPGGALGDRFGRRRTLLVGLTVFGLGAASVFFVDTPNGLIAVRAVLGVAAAVIMPATLSTITSTFPREQRARAVAIWAGVAGASAVFGVLVAGLVLQKWEWQAVFLTSTVLAAISLVGVLVVVPESAEPEQAASDPVGAVLSVVGLAALVWSIIEAPTRGWTSTPIIVGGVGGALVLAGFVAWESRRRRPLLAPRYFRNPHFSAGAASLTCQFFGFFGFITVFMQYLQLVHGWSPLRSACALLALPLGMLPTSRLAPHVLPRLGQARQAAIGVGLMSAGFFWLSRSDVGTPYWQLAAGLVLLGIGSGLSMPAGTTGITAAMPQAEQGVASAMNDLTREVGGALGIAVMSSVLTSVYKSHLTLAGVPQQIADAARGSFAAAVNLQSGGVPATMADQVATLARQSFVVGLQDAFMVAGGVCAAAALVVLFLLARGPEDAETGR